MRLDKRMTKFGFSSALASVFGLPLKLQYLFGTVNPSNPCQIIPMPHSMFQSTMDYRRDCVKT